jgi:3-oxoacyl-ACP reductase-like protein
VNDYPLFHTFLKLALELQMANPLMNLQSEDDNEKMDPSENKDKVAIVTGSANGIGHEIAIHLARNGFRT